MLINYDWELILDMPLKLKLRIECKFCCLFLGGGVQEGPADLLLSIYQLWAEATSREGWTRADSY